MLRQSVLPFKLEATDESLTSHAGLVLFGEFLKSLNLNSWIDRAFGRPGSGAGYPASSYVIPLLLMLHGGGRSLCDLRMISRDKALLTLLEIEEVPSSDAFGRWLRRVGGKEGGVDHLSPAMDRVLALMGKRLRKKRPKPWRKAVRGVTLDLDASQIVAEKESAQWTYKGEKGYMPLVAHVSELSGMVLYEEFRDGNVSPGAGHVPFLDTCLKHLPSGLVLNQLRADSASYQADVFNWCTERGVRFCIGADLNSAVRAEIEQIPDDLWRPYRGGQIAETVHCMNRTNNAFRLIVHRKPLQASLPGLPEEAPPAESRYRVLATNRKEIPEWIIDWYNQRGDGSENRIKDLKTGFGMERMPSGETKANAVFFRIGVLAYNLFCLFRGLVLEEEFSHAQIQTIRWRLYQVAGKVVRHAGAVILKVAPDILPLFQALRKKSLGLFLREGVT